jgi:hypothetical protein
MSFILGNISPAPSIMRYFSRLLTKKRILITEDRDFGELVYRLKKPAYGIVFLRFEVHERHLKWPRLNQLIDRYEGRLKGHFVVVDNEKFRFRPLKAY